MATMIGYEGIKVQQKNTPFPKDGSICSTNVDRYPSTGQGYPIPQLDVRYWQNLIGTVETFLQFPIQIIAARELPYELAERQLPMLRISEYIDMAISRARFEEIKDEEPIYAEVPGLPGVWATGKTLEECRANLRDVIDGWIEVRKRRGLQIPAINSHKLAD
jgi:predicted RNase H-like HicB family nuclease